MKWGRVSRVRPVLSRVMCAVAMLVLFAPLDVFAGEEQPSSRIKVDLSLGTWISVGDTRWSHNASSIPPLGNPTSKLTYADHSTNIVEVTAKVSVGPRWFGRLNIGFADIGGGRLTDDDFLAPDGGHPSLTTHSDINGSNMWYINADVGGRLLNYPNGRGTLDALVGFQAWHQEHQAYGVRQLSCSNAGQTIDLGGGPLCNPGATPVGNSVLAISNTVNWYSLRAGLQTDYRLTRWLSVQGAVIFKPVSFMDNKDVHHLRSDLQQNASFSMQGVGVGADVDVGAKAMLTKALSVNVGYRLWWNRTWSGTWTNHPVSGPSFSFPLNEFQSIRHGLTAGISYSF